MEPLVKNNPTAIPFEESEVVVLRQKLGQGDAEPVPEEVEVSEVTWLGAPGGWQTAREVSVSVFHGLAAGWSQSAQHPTVREICEHPREVERPELRPCHYRVHMGWATLGL